MLRLSCRSYKIERSITPRIYPETSFLPLLSPTSLGILRPATFNWKLHSNHWILSSPKCRHSMLRTRTHVSNLDQMGPGRSRTITIIPKQPFHVSLYYFEVSTEPRCVFSNKSTLKFKELESKFMVNMGTMDLRCS